MIDLDDIKSRVSNSVLTDSNEFGTNNKAAAIRLAFVLFIGAGSDRMEKYSPIESVVYVHHTEETGSVIKEKYADLLDFQRDNCSAV